jgi:hypothetical protein
LASNLNQEASFTFTFVWSNLNEEDCCGTAQKMEEYGESKKNSVTVDIASFESTVTNFLTAACQQSPGV